MANQSSAVNTAAKTKLASKYATGYWLHLFGSGPAETRCRIVIDLEQSKLIAAQEWTGLKFEDVRGDRLNDLAESVISANNAHEDPCDFGLELTSVLPEWAARREVTFRVHGYTGTEKRVAQENPHFNRDDVTAVARLRSSLLAAEKDQATKIKPSTTFGYEAVKTSEYAEEIHSALVDEVGDAEFTRTQHYQPGQEDGE